MKPANLVLSACTLAGTLIFSSCGRSSDQAVSALSTSDPSGTPVSTGGRDPDKDLEGVQPEFWWSPKPIATATSTPSAPTALVFNGSGTSASNTQSLVSIISAHGMTYQVVTSAALEAMSLDQLAAFKVIVWPGGDSNVMTSGLSAATRERVRQAVVHRGVSYAGFCAGAWMAVGPTPPAGGTPYWGLSIVKGDYLKQFYPNGQNPVAAMVSTSFANGSSRSLVWWGGPYLPSYSGSVIAKYPDGTAAIFQSAAGNGYVVLSGPHPEAPQSWRDGAGLADPDGLDFALTWNLISGALNKTRMSAY